MVCKLMRATSGDRDATSATHSLRRRLADLGADKKIIKFMELLGKDLGSLKTMFVDDVQFSHLTADQRQIIAPLVAVKPSPDRDHEEPRAQGARHPTRSPGRRDAADDRQTIPLPTKGHILSTERQQGRSLLAQRVHKVEPPTSRVRTPLTNTESGRDTIESDLVRSAHPAGLIDWFEPYDLGSRKLDGILEICSKHYFEKPSDLRQLLEDDELERYFPHRGMCASIELALGARSSAPAKTSRRGAGASTLAVKREEIDSNIGWGAGLGGQSADGAQDAWGNNMSAAKKHHDAPALRRPMLGEGPLSGRDMHTIRHTAQKAEEIHHLEYTIWNTPFGMPFK
jgi:hypothetical protein